MECVKNEKRMDKQCEIEVKEQQIYNFVDKLKTEEYKVILYNGKIPILENDLILVELTINRLNEDSTVELIDNDIMVIHTDTKIIELKGYKDMSDGEIFARQYLDTSERENLIIKDNLQQVELREDNYRNIEDYYNKCKDIVNIRTVPEDSEYYLMNWDCIIVGFYKNEDEDYFEEIWQRG